MEPLGSEAAETLALEALTWLVSDEDLLAVFLGSTGMSAADLKAHAGDAETLAALLDFLLMDDMWVRRFCEAQDIPLDHPLRARAALPGGAQVHWT